MVDPLIGARTTLNGGGGLCRKNRLSKELGKTHAKATVPASRRVNLCAKRYTISGEGKHGAASPKQAIAIGLVEGPARGVKLKPPTRGKTSASTRQKAARDLEKGQSHSPRKAAPHALGPASRR